jgi:ribA/ribD-fused uncharacterized protein
MGHTCTSSEQAFMMAKAMFFGDFDMFEKIKAENNPPVCKKLGRKVKLYVDSEWVKARFSHMVAILELKFADPKLKKILQETGDCVLAEASPYDRVWGIGRTKEQALGGAGWNGENLLGKALMQVRHSQRNASSLQK